MPDLAPGASIRLRGLNNRATLNGATGTVEAYVEEKGRYAVLVDGIRFLVQPKNIVYLGHEAATSAVAAEHVVPGHPGLRARLDVLVTQAINQAALKEEAAGHSATVAAATSREDLPPHVWERVVEIMRLVDASTKWCDVGFPALQADALEAGDGAVMSNYTSVLECLLRLRQICCCPSLVKPSRIAAAKQMLEELASHRAVGGKSVSPEDAKKLFAVLKRVRRFVRCR